MQVYQGRLTVDGLVESMMACRQGSPRDRQLFQAVLNVIYEEFQFLHNFPDKELQMTAQVLASLVRAHALLSALDSCSLVLAGHGQQSTSFVSFPVSFLPMHTSMHKEASHAPMFSVPLCMLPYTGRTMCLCTTPCRQCVALSIGRMSACKSGRCADTVHISLRHNVPCINHDSCCA